MAANQRVRKLSLFKIHKGDEASSGLSLKNLVKVCGHPFPGCVSSKKIWSRQLRLGSEKKTPPPVITALEKEAGVEVKARRVV